jgi:hypothetical protein
VFRTCGKVIDINLCLDSSLTTMKLVNQLTQA